MTGVQTCALPIYSQPGNFYEIVSSMAGAQITVSTVAVGTGADRDLLERIANWGNGRSYFSDDPGHIPQIFARETMTASKSAINEQPFQPVQVRPHQICQGIDFAEAPFLLGYVVTRAKPTAELILATEAGHPLLATWRYGLGKSLAFTADAKNRWAAEWLQWPGFSRFWSQIVRDTMRTTTRADIEVALVRTDGRMEVTVDALNPAYVGQLGSGRINAFNSVSSVASANFTASPRVGQSPLTVQFTDSSQTPATSWKWYFGDGDSAMVQNPVHTYAPGLYDVTLITGTSIGNGIKTKFNFVASLAETLTAIDTTVLAGQPAVINLYGVNKLPVDTIVLPIIASNIMAKGFLDSVVTTGCRTEYLTPQIVFDNRFFGQLAVRMAANDTLPPLPPGEGLIAKIWFRTKSTDAPGDSIGVEMGTLSSYDYSFHTGAISYAPVYHAGSVRIGALIGDLDFNGVIDAVDLSMLINIIYFGTPPPTPPEVADINCDGPIDAVDLSALIDHVFFSGPAPCQ